MFELGNPNPFNTPITHQPTAMLWIFSPRFYSHQAKRPLMYSFNNQFVDIAEEAVAQRTTGQHTAKLDALVRNPHVMSALQPSYMPDHFIDTSLLSNNWTFMLITTNDKTNFSGITHQMADNQHLYYGYFVGEPVNPLNHFGQVTPNPNAQLIITHKTLLNKTGSFGGYGQHPRLDMTADLDILYPRLVAPISRSPDMTGALTSLMRPEELYANVATGPGGEVTIMYDANMQLHHMEEPAQINAALSIPRYNIRKILDSVADAQQSLSNASFENSNQAAIHRDSYDALLAQNLMDGGRLLDQGHPVRAVLFLGALLERYRPKVEVIKQDHMPHYDPIDQMTGSHRNVFASMLAMIIPSMMVEVMLADITFTYDSHAGGDPRLVDGAILAGLTEFHPQELRARTLAFLTRLRLEIFPILVLNHGDFALTMHCTCGGVTSINLNFYSDSIASREIFEVPTILGGFNTPMVGTANAFDQNARELSALINGLSDTDRDTPNLSHYDQAQLGRGLLTYDTNTMQVQPDRWLDATVPPNNKWTV